MPLQTNDRHRTRGTRRATDALERQHDDLTTATRAREHRRAARRGRELTEWRAVGTERRNDRGADAEIGRLTARDRGRQRGAASAAVTDRRPRLQTETALPAIQIPRRDVLVQRLMYRELILIRMRPALDDEQHELPTRRP